MIFDLDDTLYYEIDFLKSAYREIASKIDHENMNSVYQKMIDSYSKNEDVFGYLVKHYNKFSKNELLEVYRNHVPEISLNIGAKDLIDYCRLHSYKMGIITDGRSITQRHKLKSLGIIELMDKIVISEEMGSTKPNQKNFTCFSDEALCEYYYIADNPKKDFIAPKSLGWKTICLLDIGYNIHPQDFTLEDSYLPEFTIKSLLECIAIIK